MTSHGELPPRSGCSALVLLSGGMDSCAVLHHLKMLDTPCRAIFIDYGQAALVHERKSASAVAEHYGVALDQVRISPGSPVRTGEVVGRNALLVLTAAMFAAPTPTLLSLGIHAGTPYYDCTAEFVTDLQRMLDGYTAGRLQVHAPFLTWNKGAVHEFCLAQAVPLHLTRSCQAESALPCGSCSSCKDQKRLHAGT